jgi:endogenous inhibitor of DNA gyrase (YacG/DUF329 family)
MANNFTTKASNIWDSISPDKKDLILKNVWCPHCSRVTTMQEYSGKVESGDLILTGKCSTCGKKVARLLESG